MLGDQTADKEHAVINEAMAHYITGQIAGAVDYSHHLPTLHNGAYNLATAPADGLEFNPAFRCWARPIPGSGSTRWWVTWRR